jgi:hypothetical protein
MENAFYSGNDPTQPEFVVIRNPEEGEYKVVSTGTGNGSYGIESTYANEETNQVLSTMFSGNANVGVDNIIDVSLNASKGEIESKIEDKTPPEISLSLADKYTRWDSLDIVAEATDLESGVADTKVFFDGVEIGNNINLNLISMSLGDHEIKVMAEDIAGNRSELVKNIVIYTDLDSTLKDLKYLFDRVEFKSYGSMFRYYSKIESLKYYPQDASSVYKNVIKNLGQELKNKQISTFAYNLIKNDILYLLGGLSEPKTT